MPHLHLSMQAGDDMVLKRMKRRHTRADAVKFCKDVLRMRPDTVFGADLIAGFPTETDAMFANSLERRRRLQSHLLCTSSPSRPAPARPPRACPRSSAAS